MAKEPVDKEPAQEEVEQPKPRGKKRLFIILAAVLVVVLIGGTAAVWVLTAKPPAGQTAETEEEPEEAKGPPIYEKLDQFTVNLADGDSYLQVEIHLQVAGSDVQQKIKQRMPEVRDGIIRLLSSMSAEELSVPEGKDLLADEVQHHINGVVGANRPSKGVKKVLFNAFIIQ